MNVKTVALIVFCSFLLILIRGSEEASSAEPTQLITYFGGEIYDSAEEGDILWLATAGGAIRFDQTSRTHIRYSQPDGIPHRELFAVVVDTAGNKWFGGDMGLSRLDPSGQWTHFSTANSELERNVVSELRTTVDGSVWVFYRDVEDVTRFRPNGSTQFFPHEAAAIASEYNTIVSSLNMGWVVGEEQVWLGGSYFDGTRWTNTGLEPVIIASANSAVWAADDVYVYRWEDNDWITHYHIDADSPAGYGVVQLHALPNGEAWVMWFQRPYSGPNGRTPFYELKRISPHAPKKLYGEQPFLAGHESGLWHLGMGLINLIDDESIEPYVFADTPHWRDFVFLTLDEDRNAVFCSGRTICRSMQTLTERGTLALHDDMMPVIVQPSWIHESMQYEQAVGGGFWHSEGVSFRFDYFSTVYRNGQERLFSSPVLDIFSESADVTWFLMGSHQYDSSGFTTPRIIRLDENGTIGVLDDDFYQEFDLGQLIVGIDESTEPDWRIAVANSRLYFGADALYRYDNGQWTKVLDERITALHVSDGKDLLVDGYRNDYWIAADLTNTPIRKDDFAKSHPQIIRAIHSENDLWKVGHDGSIWYRYGKTVYRLDRQHQIETVSLPDFGGDWTVDRHEHIWFEHDGQLARLSWNPDFDLLSNHLLLLSEAGTTRNTAVHFFPLRGFDDVVTVELLDAPTGIAVEPFDISIGEQTVTVPISVASSIEEGEYPLTVQFSSGGRVHTANVMLRVVSEVYDSWLPVVHRDS